MAGGRKAFTLLEVVAAMVIVATAVVATLAIQAGSVDTARRTAELSRATAAAEAALDAFLASPVFMAEPDGTFSSDDTVSVDGYTTEEFEIHRIIAEHTPLQEQNQIELDPDGRQAALVALGLATSGTAPGGGFKSTMATKSDTSANNDFDPGTFVAVRIEVHRMMGGTAQPKPLVVVEAWLPKPVIASTGTTTGPTTGTTGATGATGGTGGTGPTGGTGKRP